MEKIVIGQRFKSKVTSYFCSFEGCSANQFTCNNGQCVTSTARCNGLNECTDGSDELNCGNAEFIHQIQMQLKNYKTTL